MNYFNIQPITINTSPFETSTANAVKWLVSYLERSANTAQCTCKLLYIGTDEGKELYTWTIDIPEDVLNQWLDDSVIDDYICSTSNGLLVKI